MRFSPLLPSVAFAFVLAACESALAVDTAIVPNAPKLSLPDYCFSQKTREKCKENDKCIWHHNKFRDSHTGERIDNFCMVQCYSHRKEVCKGRDGCAWKIPTHGSKKEKTCVNERFAHIPYRGGVEWFGTESENLGEASTSRKVISSVAKRYPDTLYTEEQGTTMRSISLLPYTAVVLAASESALAVDTANVLNAPKSLPDDCHSRTLDDCKKNDKCTWHNQEFSDRLDEGRTVHHFCTVKCRRLWREVCEGRDGCSWEFPTNVSRREKICVNERFAPIQYPGEVAPQDGIPQYSGMESEILGEASTSRQVMPLLATNDPDTLYTQNPTTIYQEDTEWFMPGPSSLGKRARTSNVADQGESSTRKKVCTGEVPDETTTSTNVIQFMPTNEPETFYTLREGAPQRLPEGWLSLGVSADCTVEELEQPGEGSEQIDCALKL